MVMISIIYNLKCQILLISEHSKRENKSFSRKRKAAH